MSVVDIGGLALHVVTLGDGTDRPVVMLHGLLLGNLTTWYFTAAPALAKHRPVVLYDLRGHGRSVRPDSGYDVATMASDLLALLDTLGHTGPVDLVGHSFGGLVALHVARTAPERVGRLALVDTPLPPTAPAEIATFVHQSPEAMLEALPPALQEAVAGGRRQARRLLGHLVGLATETTLLADLAAVAVIPEDALRAVRAPTLLIYGDASSCRTSGEQLAATLPDARLVVLHGGHYLHLDDAAGVTAALVEFLA